MTQLPISEQTQSEMELLATMTNSTTLQLAVAVLAILVCTTMYLISCNKAKNSKTAEPVMEVGIAKGMMALGNKDYQPKVD